MSYLNEFNFISPDQSAYITKHNTQTSIHKVLNDWSSSIDDGLLVGACAIDIKKCFDTIDHSILLKKLERYGFRDDVVNWFKSYLSKRGHKVRCKNSVSSVKYVDIGVPQGSVLGPVLFLLYVNDINVHVRQGICNLYADDVLLYCTGHDIVQLRNNLQNSLDDAKEWYTQNKLVVNASKSNSILVSTNQKLSRLEYDNNNLLNVHIGNDNVPDVDVIDYLGLKIDHCLMWNDYVDQLCKKLNAKISVLSRTKCYVTRDSLVNIYRSTIQPNIDYCITAWGYTSNYNIDKVQRMQNRAARVIYSNFDFVNVRGLDLVKQLGIHNIRQRRDYFMAVLMFKAIHGLAPNYLCDEITMQIEVSQRVTRSCDSDNVYVPYFISQLCDNAFIVKGPTLWNSLPSYLKSSGSLVDFKSKCRNHFMNVFTF